MVCTSLATPGTEACDAAGDAFRPQMNYSHGFSHRLGQTFRDCGNCPDNSPYKRTVDHVRAGSPVSHWMEDQTFASLAATLTSGWRVIALDQRGHGYSGHASTYMREDYLGDLEVLFAHLGISKAVLLGNSLGGVNAYQFAARHPDYVRALIVEDIGAVVGDDTRFALSWSGVFKSSQSRRAYRTTFFFLSQGLGALSRWRVASRVRA